MAERLGWMMCRRSFFGTLMAGLAAGSAGAAPATRDPRTALSEEEDFAVPPHRVYDALLDAKQFGAFSGAPATIDRKEGGALILFGGAIVARNVELLPDKRIVQAWRDADWASGIYSMLRFEISPKNGGTHLTLVQTGFPAGQYADLHAGWHEHYLAPMKKYLR